ncbi:MAG: Sec-independent protein translocase protein TatB [Gammaproteobacteria bacterium]|jgi:sec-independent protein translocase protein TatB|uniref:Sec-independent protein translocase protein TatB n=1 Tax=unclassified Limnobacter TaxID=2630203 RepID=UPI000156CA2B|nr:MULTISPECIES: Sec-independent protein translocase protein TatB [unclassified Limnobacter]EDM85136.1 Twin-arginine translocation protein TatB [Limnobacter sp. MED105]MAZ10580.1 twin-arginine translocase subunit TatB [Sutterellaceae bacterium]MBU0542519.1 Sec-independent protein translocase protein TatB [Gammaproteobacteria bacterium]|tara:strand:- start:3463 stop:3891 length:429 start_codon:yes stop_codon:yes gene_type:complete
MFDIAFSEMLIIAVIALLVIGPEKLPKVAKTVGHLLGKAQRYVSDVKSEINREMEIDELRKLQAEMQTAARKMEGDVQSTIRDTEADLNKSVKSIEDDIAELEASKPASTAPQTTTQASVTKAEESSASAQSAGPAPKAEAK